MKITPRQRKILDLLSEKPTSRESISRKLQNEYPISKVTLYRELKKLQGLNLIKSVGQGKKTKYVSLENPLTKYIDIKEYFREDFKRRREAKKSFDFKVFDYLGEVINEKEKQELKKILKKLSVQEKKLDSTIFRREIERFTVEFSWKSSRIEGNTYTLLETEILIKQMKEAVGHPKYEAIMILNHKYAIDYILKNKDKFKKLTLKKLFDLHQILTKDLEITSGIRKHAVAIIGTNYVPLNNSFAIQNAVKKTLAMINKTEFPVAKALIASSMVAYIQPFTDGNKRASRTLANAILITYDLYPISYRDVSDIDYIEAMILFYEQNNLYHLKRIFLEQLKFATENYFRI